jgi:hypothetical protein
MGVWGQESYLPLRITAVGAVCVGLDEFPDGEPVRGFFGEMVSCWLMSCSPCLIRRGNAVIRVWPVVRETP